MQGTIDLFCAVFQRSAMIFDTSMRRQVVLIVLDGWGIGRTDESNPIHVVGPQTFRYLEENFPAGTLAASGISVGLPWGEIGNSEVGHLTLGAGKIVYQYYPKITLAIRDRSFFENEVLKSAIRHVQSNGSALNLVGLLSKGNVHASLEHLLALIQMAENSKIPYKLHLFADGKDSPPRSIEKFLKEIPLDKVATLIGRYYAMDRENNWSLTEQAYRTLVGEGGTKIAPENILPFLKKIYAEHSSEEFVPPLLLKEDGGIKDGEALIFFNFREDSIRQIAETFIEPGFDRFRVNHFTNLFIATMTKYEERLNAPIIFPADTVREPLGKVLSDFGKTQLRIAETYKYAHVTYFFNGHTENPFPNEYRVLIPSLATIHADEHPEMRAPAITDRLIQAIKDQSFDFVLANYANPDTIGHTGNYNAALEVVRVIDREMGRVITEVLNTQTSLIITSDHGNIEEILNPMTGEVETQHDPNPVPIYLVGKEFMNRKFLATAGPHESLGILSDIAPTILSLLEIPKPQDMTGHDLTKRLT